MHPAAVATTTPDTPPRAQMALRLVRALPSHLLNGLSVSCGIAGAGLCVGAGAGLTQAFALTAGMAAVSVADTPAAPRAKLAQILPAVASGSLIAVLVHLAAGHAWALGLVVVATAFAATLWTAWGKRGNPQSFVMILSLIFQMAAHASAASQGRDGRSGWIHVEWTLAGNLAAGCWAVLSGWALAARYRTLAFVECVQAMAELVRMQADLNECLQVSAPQRIQAATLALIREQVGIADTLQTARDLLYCQTRFAPQQTLAQALVRLVDLRDQLLAVQLDVECLPNSEVGRAALPHLSRVFDAMAVDLDNLAHAVRQGLPPPAGFDLEAPRLAMVAAAEGHHQVLAQGWVSSLAAVEGAGEAVRADTLDPQRALALVRTLDIRLGHMVRDRRLLSAALRKEAGSLPLERHVMLSFVSPSDWPVAALAAQATRDSPVLRFALRASMAMGCAYLLTFVLPWGTHKHWILLTVGVVMRGSLEQTMQRRNARIVGTVVGCLLASALLALHASPLVLLLVGTAGVCLLHAYVQINYRIASAAGAVLGLLQSYVLAHAPGVAAVERLTDTLLGAGLAWGFSYVLPAWERQQLPALAGRLLKAEANYARSALLLHRAGVPDRRWRLARRDVYDVLWTLTQTLQRMSKEPTSVQLPVAVLEQLLVCTYRLTSHIAAIKTTLTLRRNELDEARIAPALKQADSRIAAALLGPAKLPEPGELIDARESGELPIIAAGDPNPWVLRRLHWLERDAFELGRVVAALSEVADFRFAAGAADRKSTTSSDTPAT